MDLRSQHINIHGYTYMHNIYTHEQEYMCAPHTHIHTSTEISTSDKRLPKKKLITYQICCVGRRRRESEGREWEKMERRGREKRGERQGLGRKEGVLFFIAIALKEIN